MSKILIAGCGDVGSALGERLAADGHQVWGLRRSTNKLPASILPLAGDLTDPATLTDLPMMKNPGFSPLAIYLS